MVRINLIDPVCLTDQHLIAEYNEMLMLVSYIERYPSLEKIPNKFTLNTGHMKFFKNKLGYLKKRHELIKKEMRSRNFVAQKSIDLKKFPLENKNGWEPTKEDKNIIKKRISEKIKMKPEWYRYYQQHKSLTFYLNLLQKG